MAVPDILDRQFKQTEDVREYWEKQRRGDILQMFSRSLYGRIPEGIGLVCMEQSLSRDGYMHFVKKIILGTDGFGMRLALHLPSADGKYPAIIYLCLAGQQEDFVPVRLLMNSGFAVAVIFSEDVAQDSINAKDTGIFQWMKSQNIDTGCTGNLGAWAWGIEQAKQYLLQDACIIPDEISLAGYSRGGKTALYACALYGGFFACSAVHSGCCGASLFRKIPADKESLKDIYNSFPYWFVDEAKAYADTERELPFDQHMLLALCAPVRLCILNADEDQWCDAQSEKESSSLAAGIFNLYSQKQSHIFYKLRKGNHDMDISDWEEIMRVSRKYRCRNL